MPIYAYKCDSCGFAKDVLQKLSDPPLAQCPACGASTFRKQVTAAGFQLKGSGWYATDFKDGGNKKPQGADDKPADAAPADAKSEKPDSGSAGKGEGAKSAESKPAAKPAEAPAAKAADAKPAAGSSS